MIRFSEIVGVQGFSHTWEGVGREWGRVGWDGVFLPYVGGCRASGTIAANDYMFLPYVGGCRKNRHSLNAHKSFLPYVGGCREFN